MTRKKIPKQRRKTHKNIYIQKAGRFNCIDLLPSYIGKVIYLGVDLDWNNLVSGFKYVLKWDAAPAPGVPASANEIEFILGDAAIVAAAETGYMANSDEKLDIENLNTIEKKSNEYAKVETKIDEFLKTDDSQNHWNDFDEDAIKTAFKYNLNNVIIPRYDSGQKENTRIYKITSSHLIWNKDNYYTNKKNQVLIDVPLIGSTVYSFFGNTKNNVTETDQTSKGVEIAKNILNERQFLDIIHETMRNFRIHMKEILIDYFKRNVKNNIEKILEIVKSKTNGSNSGSIERTCELNVTGKLYFGIKMICAKDKIFEIHEIIFPNMVDPQKVTLDIALDNELDSNKIIIENLKTYFMEEKTENIDVHLEDLDALLLFGNTETGVKKRGNYGKHNVPTKPDKFDFQDAQKIFKIIRKKEKPIIS